jgi:hypothetical protein
VGKGSGQLLIKFDGCAVQMALDVIDGSVEDPPQRLAAVEALCGVKARYASAVSSASYVATALPAAGDV